DFNGDGKRDLAVAGYENGGNGGYVLLRKADNSGFALEGGVLAVPSTNTVAVGDLDGNGKSDLVFGTLGPNAVYYALRNDAGTAFNAPVKLQSVGQKGAVALGDFTGDGQLDIVAANWTSPASIELWVQNDNHTFPVSPSGPFNTDREAYGMAVADFNKDGRLDVAAGDNPNDKVVVMLGKAGGGFVRENSYPVGDSPTGVETADFNFDGRPDIAVANQGGKRVSVLLRTATGGFVNDRSSPILTNQAATGIATADFDADKRVDMAVANLSSNTLSILLNRTPFPTPPPVDLDADNDGVQRPTDCNDNNPAIFPGAKDKPGDGVDQDCRGGDASFPVLKRTIAYKLGYGDAYTVFSVLKVKPARKGDRIRFACKGKGCERKKATVKVKKNGAAVSLTKYVKDAQLKPGTRIEIRITHKNSVGSFRRFTIRAGKLPKQKRRCLAPGSSKPTKCA
ncbi:MAG: FG-GAP-like repeat-containing protein, partial [Solirubrobacteraceae bacterium]